MITSDQSKKVGKQAVKDGLANVGVKEVGNNWGPFVKIYLAFVGLFIPSPWCAAFVAYRVHTAAKKLGLSLKWPKTGYVQSIVNWAKKNSNIYPEPRVNHAFVVYHPELKRYAHIGLIADKRVKGGNVQFLTVEGNSNLTGAREGKEVVSTWRDWDPARHKSIKIV